MDRFYLYHLREHPSARDGVCSGNARFETGRPFRDNVIVAGRTSMKGLLCLQISALTVPDIGHSDTQIHVTPMCDCSHYQAPRTAITEC